MLNSLPRGLAAILLFLGLALAAGCDNQTQTTPEDAAGASGDRPFVVVATIGMVADIAAQVAGDRAEVRGLIGSGIDPHLFKPTRTDIEKLLDAEVIFYNGLLLEGKMTDALINAAGSGKRVHAVTELLDDQFLLDDGEGHDDPHVWMDPQAWTQAVHVIRDKLTEFDPDGAETYAANAESYAAQLAQLDAYAESVLTSVPEGRRVLVTAHDAFNYFGQRFGFEVVGIQGLSTESEAGVRDIETLVDMLVERQIGAVFVESTVSERNVRALITGAGAQDHTVTIGGELFSDAMGDPGTYEGTYIGMIDHNVTTIARALGGQAPQDGMQAKLSN